MAPVPFQQADYYVLDYIGITTNIQIQVCNSMSHGSSWFEILDDPIHVTGHVCVNAWQPITAPCGAKGDKTHLEVDVQEAPAQVRT